MANSKKPTNFGVFNLAKDLRLPNAEKVAIRAIADHVRKPTGYCSASLQTLARESGASERHLRYGIHGRSKEDGSKYHVGLLERGLIFLDEEFSGSKGGRSIPVTYRVNLQNWREYLPEERRPDVDLLLPPDSNDVEEKAAQTRHN